MLSPRLAVADHRAGAPQRAGRRHPARHGQRQRRPRRRPGPGRGRDRPLGCPAGLRADRGAAGVLAVVLLAWRRPRVTHGEREPFLPALVAGGRYVRHEPVVRRILLRFATFMVPACAVWALLPLIASRQLGLDADGYGLLFAALGLGAVVGRPGSGPGQAAPVVQRGAGAGRDRLRAGLRRRSCSCRTCGSRCRCWWSAASAGPRPCRPSSPSCSCSCPAGCAPAPSRST